MATWPHTTAQKKPRQMTVATTSPATASPPATTIPLDDVVEHFLHLAANAGASLTHLKLQALCSRVQALYWSRSGRPLFDERVEAWGGTAILPALYHRYEEWEDRSIPPARPAPPELPEPGQHAAITDIFERYGRLNVVDLVSLDMYTIPWQEVDRENRAEIPADLLQRYGRWLDTTADLAPPAARP